MISVLGAITLSTIGQSLHEALSMLWDTLWALLLGFTLSGAVQAFVSKARMQRTLGDHSPAAVAKASGFGMVSSSCSYAASAMAKSLFQKGADFLSAMVFMFASTNLVVELGIVLIVLMGWPFAAAEFVGGPIMIVLLVLVGSVAIRGPVVAAARRRLEGSGDGAHDQAGHDHHEHAGPAEHDHAAMTGVSESRQAELDATPWRTKIRRKADWADAASYTMADLSMIRRELVIGFVVAGFLTVLVPMDWWNHLFITGHGFWTSLENALVGPIIACLSFVCSIGNVPMAAALWHGGISFGGVISFLFADLLALPLIFIYRRYYGGRLTVRLVAVFYLVMVAAGLAVEGIFSLFGWIPTERPEVAMVHVGWSYTTVLNVVALVGFAVVVWLARHRHDLGGGRGYAIDPVCGMQVRTADAPATDVRDGVTTYFCGDGCRDRFVAQRTA